MNAMNATNAINAINATNAINNINFGGQVLNLEFLSSLPQC